MKAYTAGFAHLTNHTDLSLAIDIVGCRPCNFYRDSSLTSRGDTIKFKLD